MNLMRAIYRPVVTRAARKAFVGKNRARNCPERGRFTVGEVNEFLREAWRRVERMAPNLNEQTFGSRMNVMLACLSLSMLMVLLARGVERRYAIELISDAAWKVYQKWAIVPKLFARVVGRNGAKRLAICVNAFLRFPFNPPGYSFERLPSDCGIAFNIIRCPVASYLQTHDAADLCVASWCNLDFALAEMWVGRSNERELSRKGGNIAIFISRSCPRRGHKRRKTHDKTSDETSYGSEGAGELHRSPSSARGNCCAGLFVVAGQGLSGRNARRRLVQCRKDAEGQIRSVMPICIPNY